HGRGPLDTRRRVGAHCRAGVARPAPCGHPWRGRARAVHRPCSNRYHRGTERGAHRRGESIGRNFMIKTSIAWRNAAAVSPLSWLACSPPATAQQQPTPSAIATAKELLMAKNATTMFDPIVPGVIQTTMNTFLPTNPNLFKELNEVAGRLRNELAPRRNEIV